jgi:hypothetical protein
MGQGRRGGAGRPHAGRAGAKDGPMSGTAKTPYTPACTARGRRTGTRRGRAAAVSARRLGKALARHTGKRESRKAGDGTHAQFRNGVHDLPSSDAGGGSAGPCEEQGPNRGSISIAPSRYRNGSLADVTERTPRTFAANARAAGSCLDAVGR